MILRCVVEKGGRSVNEFKTNDLKEDVYRAPHFATLFNGSETDDMRELVDDDEGHSFSTKVIQC